MQTSGKPNVYIAALLLITLAVLPALAAPRAVELTPKVVVTLPDSPGFASIDEIPLLRDYATHFTPTINLYLAGYISDTDMKAWKEENPETWARWAFVQTFRQTIGQELDPRELDGLKAELDAVRLDPAKMKEVSAFIDEEVKAGEKALSEKLNSVFTAKQTANLVTKVEKLDGPIVLFTMVSTVDRDEGKGTLASCGTAFMVKGRIMYVYVYSDLKGKEDVAFVEGKALEWARAIIAANK